MDVKKGQNYLCVNGNGSFTKGKTYHVQRDGYLTDDNGITWHCCKEFMLDHFKQAKREVKEICEDISNLADEVVDYILSTPNCLFYWIKNEEVRKFIEDNPEDYDTMFDIDVISLDGNSCVVKIKLDICGENETTIMKRCCLATFRKIAMAQFCEHEGKLNEAKIQEMEKSLEFHKERIRQIETELENLKREGK